MIRLIDVALIILLGFIAISRLKTEYVDLPSGGESEPVTERTLAAALHIHRDFFRYEQNGKGWTCKSIEELENLLSNQSSNLLRSRVKLIVSIEPHKSSIMQKLVDVLDICHRNKIEKNLNYENYY